MDSSLIATENKDAFIQQLHAVIEDRLSEKEAKGVKAFAEQYFDQFPLNELEGRQLNDIYGCTYAWWNFIQAYDKTKPKITIYNTSLEEDGWLCGHTIIGVLQRDMPFLVDSIRMELNRRNIYIHTIKSTVISTVRNTKHDLKELLEKGGKSNKSADKEALIYLEVNRHSSEAEIDELLASLTSVLADVSAVVDAYRPLQAQVNEVDKSLNLVAKGALKESVEESQEFLRWLNKGYFTLMGYSEYEFIEEGKKKVLVEQPEKRLGLCQLHGRKDCRLSEDNFNDGMKRFHLSTHALTFSKSSVRSRVHRQAYSDYVIVKRYDKKGNVCGESRFLGLYTAPVYNLDTTKIPLIRNKVEKIMARSGLDPSSHDGKVLRRVLDTSPRDETFLASTNELYDTAVGVARINERHMVRLFMRKGSFGKFVTCIVYVPRDVFSSQIREKIQKLIGGAVNSIEDEFTTYFSESILARAYLVFKVDPSKPIEYDVKRLEEKIIDITRTWDDLLLSSLTESHGEEKGSLLFREYGSSFGSGYRENFEARAALSDIETIGSLKGEEDIAMSFYQPVGSDKNTMRFKVFHLNTGLELSDVIPVLEHLGLRVIGEHPYKIKKSNGEKVWLHDFDLQFGLPITIDVNKAKAHFQEAFEATWRGQAESDAFNRLVLGARLNWREVAMLRTYARYMKQTAFNFSLNYIANTLANHLEITRNLVALFKASFDPRINQLGERETDRVERLKSKILEGLDGVDNLNEDRIIRRYLDLMNGSLRTNFFQPDELGESKSYISIKFSPRSIPDIPEPRPMYEIFVYSPRVEGVHLRGGKVARGGLRWSDRLQDYRTEVLGLVKAQQVKNAVIVPSGAKGGFVSKLPPTEGGREAFLAEGIECYKIFIKGLLDVTDNLVDGEISPPEKVVRLDDDDPYLVVAADKGTATFSDIANGISEEYGHWLGDAFASGGSQGYDHKGMGITAKGAWVSVQRHFKEQGINVQTEDFTTIGVGDMAGDVFGNGMLLSEHTCLVAAFNHMHIFIDPNPDSAKSFVERKRLFETPRTTWADYDKKLISKGGAIFSRDAKSITISAEMKERFKIKADKLAPTELLNALLKAPVDLIWNGGIGTYVKAESETHNDVGDKATDNIRVNGNELRCKVFGEGGNLGMTQLGRIEFCLNGGACNTDFIDNAAGVDCSDHEVNIKILLNEVMTAGDMTEKQRNKLLEQMTDVVGELVLTNNYRQTQAISIAERHASERFGEYRRFINTMESDGRLDRGLEFIPEDDALLERQTQGKSITRPELSVLISYAKVMLKEELAESDVPEDAYMAEAVETAFPPVLLKKYKEQMYNHRLSREIVATQVANDMVNNMGINFCMRMMESTGSTAGQVAKAYVTAREIYQMEGFWQEVEVMDYKIPADLQIELMARMARQVRRATRWFLRNRRSLLEPAVEITTFSDSVQSVITALPELLRGDTKKEWKAEYKRLTKLGLPESLATRASVPANLYSGLGMVEAAKQGRADVVRVAEIYFALGDHLGLHWFANQIADVHVESYWQAMAREAFMDDLESQMRTLAISLIRLSDDGQSIDELISLWNAQHEVLVDRWKSMINELQGAPGTDYAMFSVALRELLDLAQASQHCQSFDDDSGACTLGT